MGRIAILDSYYFNQSIVDCILCVHGWCLMTDTLNNLNTMLYCPTCDDLILRSRRFDHKHTLLPKKPDEPNTSTTDDGEKEYEYGGDEPMEVGGVYTVEVYYEYVVRETVVAPSQSIAEDMVDMSAGHITHELWSDTSKNEVIYEDDDRAEEHDLTPL